MLFKWKETCADAYGVWDFAYSSGEKGGGGQHGGPVSWDMERWILQQGGQQYNGAYPAFKGENEWYGGKSGLY